MIDVPDLEELLSAIPSSHGWHQLAKRVKLKSNIDLNECCPWYELPTSEANGDEALLFHGAMR